MNSFNVPQAGKSLGSTSLKEMDAVKNTPFDSIAGIQCNPESHATQAMTAGMIPMAYGGNLMPRSQIPIRNIQQATPAAMHQCLLSNEQEQGERLYKAPVQAPGVQAAPMPEKLQSLPPLRWRFDSNTGTLLHHNRGL